jgi:hypothetical protein
MPDIHRYSEQDTAIALVVMKTTELMRSLGADLIKFSVEPIGGGICRVYARNEEDQVYEMLVSNTREDGTHLFSFQSYSLGVVDDDYRQWHASSEEEFTALIDDEILALNASQEHDLASHAM